MSEQTERTFYLSDFLDETMPCDGTLEGWARWLSRPDEDWGRGAPADEGQVFDGSAFRWHEDIIATREGGLWSLSREPGETQFIAVRFGPGMGWSADNIVTENMAFVEGEYKATETMAEALLHWLSDNDEFCDDIEYVAVGENENGWRFTYHADPPRLQAERVQ